MKIVHVISGLTKGGGERVAVELANTAVKNGDEVTIVAGWPVNPEYLQNSINPMVNLKFIGHTKGLAYLKIIPWIIKNKNWIFGYNVVHCHLTYGAFLGSFITIFSKIFFWKKPPIIVETYHAVGMPIPKFNRWVHSQMVLMRNGLVLMAKDPYWNTFMVKHPRLKIEIIPNGIAVLDPSKNLEQQQSFRQQLHIPDSCKYLVGTVGMFRPDRKPWLYIPLFKDIYTVYGNDVHFIMAGAGIEFDKIKIMIEEQGLSEQVYLPGQVNDPSIAIANIDIYVSVSVGETTGISMVEAAMCNKPVVGIQLIENYQAKNEDWVWSHTDTKEVAKKIIFLLQNKEERTRLTQNQNKYVNTHFTSDAMYSSYNTFYNKILTD